jgi:hypothetical protein
MLEKINKKSKHRKARRCARFKTCNLGIKGEAPCIKGKCQRFVEQKGKKYNK